MISPLELQRLRDLPIEGVAQRLGLEVIRHKALCPFHADKHPSLSFSTSRNSYRCWVCGAGGGTIDLVMQVRKTNFCEACEWLGASHDLPTASPGLPKGEGTGSPQKGGERGFEAWRYARFFEHPFLSDVARKFLFEERMLDPRVISWCRVTSWQDRNGVNWLQIPYYDLEGKLIGLQNRNLNYPARPLPIGEAAVKGFSPRFRFPYGSHCSIYNLPVLRLLQPHGECWIAEGSSDCWSLLSDHHKAIAIASATLLQPRDKELLLRVSKELSVRWKMAPDRDEPGRRLACQLKEILPDLEIVELPEGCKDYSDSYVKRHKGNS